MSGLRREHLQHFVNMQEKSYPPVFVGRETIINKILAIAETTRIEATGIPGNTTVIQGAPGSGKSSVLGHLARHNTDDRAPKTLHISSVELDENFTDVLLAIAALGRTDKSKLKYMAMKTTRSVGSLALLDAIGLINMNLQDLKDLFWSHDIQNIMSLHKAFPADQWDTPMIVAIDEAQNLPPGRVSQPAKFLRTLHEAVTKLPLTLVLAGLGDTQSVIRSMGLTHGLRPHPLGCFDAEELDELTGAWCAHFGITVGAQRDRIDRLMSPTDGWPRHVHWAQQALAEALLVPGVDGDADRITDWTTVHHRSDQLRHGYYQTQFSDVMDYSPKLTAQILYDVALAEMQGNILNASQIRKKIKSYCESDRTGDFECPPEHTYAEFITHLIHCGALQQDPDNDGILCPIPSFQSYIIARGGFEIPRT